MLVPLEEEEEDGSRGRGGVAEMMVMTLVVMVFDRSPPLRDQVPPVGPLLGDHQASIHLIRQASREGHAAPQAWEGEEEEVPQSLVPCTWEPVRVVVGVVDVVSERSHSGGGGCKGYHYSNQEEPYYHGETWPSSRWCWSWLRSWPWSLVEQIHTASSSSWMGHTGTDDSHGKNATVPQHGDSNHVSTRGQLAAAVASSSWSCGTDIVAVGNPKCPVVSLDSCQKDLGHHSSRLLC